MSEALIKKIAMALGRSLGCCAAGCNPDEWLCACIAQHEAVARRIMDLVQEDSAEEDTRRRRVAAYWANWQRTYGV